MKKHIFFLFLLSMCLPTLAQKKTDQCSENEFRVKKEAYITKKAQLTPEEAAAFFPLYFELQDLKSENNSQAWIKGRKGKNPQTTESEYEDIIQTFVEANQKNNELEKAYLKKYREILSYKKIYMVLKAEILFNRNMLKIMQSSKEETK